MGKEDITVIIPVYNRAAIVMRTLRSVGCQTYRPLHVILVDNGSTDGTLDILRQWKRSAESEDLTIDILSEPTPGATAARNRGLAAATSEYVMFFDSDDTMHPTHVERAMRGFSHPSHPDIVGWDVTMHDIHGHTRHAIFSAVSPLWHNIMNGSMATQRYAARTSLIRKAGGWDTSIRGWNDIELGARLLRLNPVMLKLAGDPTVEIFQQNESITGTGFTQGAGRWEKSLDAIEAILTAPRHRRWVRLRRAHLAGLYAAEGSHTLSQDLLKATLAAEPSPLYRSLLRATCALTARKIRGALRLFRPLF